MSLHFWPLFQATKSMLRDPLPEIVVIDCSNVCDYMFDRQTFSITEDVPMCAPPFDMTFVEGSTTRGGDRVHLGVFVNAVSLDELESYLKTYPMFKEPFSAFLNRAPEFKDGWFMVCFTYSQGVSRNMGDWLGVAIYGCNKDGTLHKVNGRVISETCANARIKKRLDSKNIAHDMEKNLLEFVESGEAIHATIGMVAGMGLLTFCFMHCKNVKTVKHTPSRIMQKLAKPDKKPYEFHTLVIEPMTRLIDDEARRVGNGTAKALHICRGHFKNFTGKGLFGKHRGMYWWSSMVRGTADRVVEKNYEVKP